MICLRIQFIVFFFRFLTSWILPFANLWLLLKDGHFFASTLLLPRNIISLGLVWHLIVFINQHVHCCCEYQGPVSSYFWKLKCHICLPSATPTIWVRKMLNLKNILLQNHVLCYQLDQVQGKRLCCHCFPVWINGFAESLDNAT